MDHMTVELTALHSEPLIFHLSIKWTHITQPDLPNIHSNNWRLIQL